MSTSVTEVVWKDELTGQKKWLVELSGSKEAAVANRTAVYLGGAAIAEYVSSASY